MKRFALLAILFLALPAFAQENHQAAPELPYRVIPNFFKLPPNVYMMEAVGVAVDAKGDIYVANRGNHPLMEFAPNGSYMGSIGDGFPLFAAPHAVRIDPRGNLWYIDAENNLVIKFDPERRIQLVLGRRSEPWTWLTHVVQHAPPPPDSFYQPTDVTWGPDGSIFVTDGYGNSRVVKFDKDGRLVKYWGDRGTGPGQFHTPHNIVIDNEGHLYVADRSNSRIEVFDTDGKFLRQWHYAHPPWSLCITPGPHQVIYVGSINQVYKINLNGKELGWFGKPGRGPGDFNWVHAVACPNANTVYAAQETSWRVEKVELGPTQ